MDVACQNCSAMYPISEQKLAGRVVRFRCKHCGTAILVDGRVNKSSPPGPASQPPLSLGAVTSATYGGVLAAQPAMAQAAQLQTQARAAAPFGAFPAQHLPAQGLQAPRMPSVPGPAAARPHTAPAAPPAMVAPSQAMPASPKRVPSLPPSAPPLPPEVFAPGYGGLAHGGAPGPNMAVAAQATPTQHIANTFSGDGGLAMVVPLTRPSHVERQSSPRGPGIPGPSSPSAVSQPLPPPGGWDVEVDPSVYEDETVAMTASELEAAADAKPSLPPPAAAPLPFRSQPPPKPWVNPPPSSSSPGAISRPGPASPLGPNGFAAPLLPHIAPPISSNPLLFPSSDVPSSGVSAVGPLSYQPVSHQPVSHQPPSPGMGGPTRAESWALGRPLPPSAIAVTERPLPGERPVPAPPSARTWTSVEPHVPPPKENRWMFPLLLVTLGVGGLVLGGVLGKTWIAHFINPTQTPVTVTATGPAVDPNLAPFAPLEANTALENAQRDAVHCLSADATPLTGLIVARFNPNGTLENIQMSGSLGSAAEAPCVRSIFEKVSVVAFSGPPAQVEKAIELRPQP